MHVYVLTARVCVAEVRGFREPGFRHIFCAVSAWIRHLRKPPRHLLAILQWKITVSTNLRDAPRFSAKLPHKLRRQMSESWLAKLLSFSHSKTMSVATQGVSRRTSSRVYPLPRHNVARMSYHARRRAARISRKNTCVTTKPKLYNSTNVLATHT